MTAEDKDGVMREAADKMKKAVSVNAEELASIRSGRATPALLNKIQVDYYGTMAPSMRPLTSVNIPFRSLKSIQSP